MYFSVYFSTRKSPIRGKTADCTAVQKTIMNTLHKDSKQLKFTAERAGYLHSAVLNILVGRKINKQQG